MSQNCFYNPFLIKNVLASHLIPKTCLSPFEFTYILPGISSGLITFNNSNNNINSTEFWGKQSVQQKLLEILTSTICQKAGYYGVLCRYRNQNIGIKSYIEVVNKPGCEYLIDCRCGISVFKAPCVQGLFNYCLIFKQRQCHFSVAFFMLPVERRFFNMFETHTKPQAMCGIWCVFWPIWPE